MKKYIQMCYFFSLKNNVFALYKVDMIKISNKTENVEHADFNWMTSELTIWNKNGSVKRLRLGKYKFKPTEYITIGSVIFFFFAFFKRKKKISDIHNDQN